MFKNRIKSIYYIILKPGENIHGTPWNSTHSLSGKHWDISQHLPVGWPHIITNRPHANPSTHTSIILGWRSRALCGFLQRPYRNWAAFLVYLFIYLFISSSVALVFELFSYFINFNEKNKKSCQNSFSEEFVALKKVQALPLFDQWTAAAAASLHHYSNWIAGTLIVCVVGTVGWWLAMW